MEKVKLFFSKVWAGIKWVWAKIVAAALFIKDFAVWVKNRGKAE